jgi:hypothetical protein
VPGAAARQIPMAQMSAATQEGVAPWGRGAPRCSLTNVVIIVYFDYSSIQRSSFSCLLH